MVVRYTGDASACLGPTQVSVRLALVRDFFGSATRSLRRFYAGFRVR